MKPTKRPVNKKLRKPIEVERPPSTPSILGGAGLPDVEARHRRDLAKWKSDALADMLVGTIERWKEVWAHYGIEPPECFVPANGDAWQLLANAMAMDLFPGFGVIVEKSNKPSKWTASQQIRLYLDVRSRMQARNLLVSSGSKLSANEACRQLAKVQPWKALLTKERDAFGPAAKGESLYSRYMEAKKNPIVWVLGEAERLGASDVELSEVEKHLRSFAKDIESSTE